MRRTGLSFTVERQHGFELYSFRMECTCRKWTFDWFAPPAVRYDAKFILPSRSKFSPRYTQTNLVCWALNLSSTTLSSA